MNLLIIANLIRIFNKILIKVKSNNLIIFFKKPRLRINELSMVNFDKILLLDGYIDEPSAFGVPPYLSFHLRYIYGAIKNLGLNCTYITIDQYRKLPVSHVNDMKRPDLVIIVAGCIVPGKYLLGTTLNIQETQNIIQTLEPKMAIFGGAAARFGYGGIGGEKIILAKNVKPLFDLVAKQDIDATVFDFLQNEQLINRKRTESEWNTWSKYGSELITKHPDFPQPLIVEIETSRGCPRFINGGCNFCIEPLLGTVITRQPKDIIAEIEFLYKFGARNFRLCGQTDVYAYNGQGIGDQENPVPNVESWRSLLTGIWNVAPELQVLHLDNANPAVIAQFPVESREITKLFVNYCTAGNLLPFGLESADPEVQKANNLNATNEETIFAIKQLNELGRERGPNGLPKLLPGLNFISGLLKETKYTFELNYEFLKKVQNENLLLRRINLRQVAGLLQDFKPEKYKELFQRYKTKIREEIDQPMLRQLAPVGTILKNVYMETYEQNFTHGRQIGTYSLLLTVPFQTPINKFADVMVVDYGFRSLSVLPLPLEINTYSKKSLTYLPNIGKKRAETLYQALPLPNVQAFVEKLDDTKGLDLYKEHLKF